MRLAGGQRYIIAALAAEDGVVFHLANPKFRALEVLDDGHICLPAFEPPGGSGFAPGMVLAVAMGKIQPGGIHAGWIMLAQ